MHNQISYITLNTQLKLSNIPVTAAELDGFLCGLICGGVKDKDWQNLLFQFTHDDHCYPMSLLNNVIERYKNTKQSLVNLESFDFQLFLPENESVFQQADALSEWVNHFILGLGILLPNLNQEKEEIAEALRDLQEIAKLSYEINDSETELEADLEEVKEYVRTLVMLFYTHFCHNSHITKITQHLH